MTEINPQELKKSFHQDIINLYKMINKIVKYKPTRLMDFINKYGGYEAAVKYITTESNVQDFAVLWECERLDLSVEALITNEKYRSIFSEDVLAYCDRKLKEYSYAPNKIEEVEEPTGYFDEEESDKIDIEEFLRQKELMKPKIVKKDFKIYKYSVDITKEDWESILLNTKVVTASNLDFLLRVYSIGDEVGPAELGKEKGFSANYPYKEVMMALGKRIKTALKVDVPVGEDNKPLWWHLLFNGGFKDNNAFEWSLKSELREALDELIAQGQVQKVEVGTQKALVPIEEEVLVKEENKVEKTKTNDEGMSAFDRLFASIMSDVPVAKEEKVEREVVKPNPVVEPSMTIKKAVVDENIKEQKSEEKQSVTELKQEENNVSPQEATKTIEESKIQQEKVAQLEDYKTSIKKACLEYYGAICDICGFDYGYTYGEAYENMIEVHNIHQQDSEEILPNTDPVKDLIPVCCNCHKVIHSKQPPINVDDMRNMVKA